MGLRLRLVALMVAILGLLATISLSLLSSQIESNVYENENLAAEKDMHRLMMAFGFQATQLEVVLGGWANWTSFYEHIAQPNEKFRREELSQDSLTTTQIDFLGHLDDTGLFDEFIEVPQSDKSMPVTELIRISSEKTLLEFGSMLNGKNGCGVIQPITTKKLYLVCYTPLVNSEGKGKPRGTVLIGRWISPKMLDQLREHTALDVRLTIKERTTHDAMSPDSVVSSFGHGAITTTQMAENLILSFPIVVLTGKNVGSLDMHWPRNSLEKMHETKLLVKAVAGLLIGLTGILLVLAIDQLVVRRLNLLKRQVSEIVDAEDWQLDIRISGTDEIAELAARTNSIMAVIRQQMLDLKNLSLTDPMTGLANRRHFDLSVTKVLAQFRRDGLEGALLLFDVDFFKRYNDIYGHPAGDAALIAVADCLRKSVRRPGDLTARLGGEEFAALLAITTLEGALLCAEATRSSLLAAAIPHQGNEAIGVVTISCGIALLKSDDTAETLYSRADAALYEAKQLGRNRIAVG